MTRVRSRKFALERFCRPRSGPRCDTRPSPLVSWVSKQLYGEGSARKSKGMSERVPTPTLSTTDAVPEGAFVRSAIVSVLATASDFVVAALLARASVAASVATFFGCAVGGLVAFLVNRGWAFRSRGHRGAELLRFLGVWATSALLNSGGVGWLTHAGLPFMYAWPIVRGLVYSGWNYPLLRWFVFRRPTPAAY